MFRMSSFPSLVRCKRYIAIFLFIGLLHLSILPAQAEVRLPNGEYRTSATDLRVKTLGGSVSIERSWQATNLNRGEFRWYVNPAWADLDLEIDSSDGSIRSIKRAGAKFAKQGEDLYVLKESDRAYFIRVTRDAAGVRTGLTWSDRRGNVIDYDVTGRILGYRERNGVSVHFQRDAEGRIATVSDHHDQTVFTFTWANGQLASISDYSGRQVQYHYTNSQLTEVIDVLGHAWGYGYSGGLLHTQTDPENHTTTIDYAGNRASRVTDAQGFITTYRYDYNRGTRQYDVTVTTPEGKVEVGRYDAEGKLLRQETGTRLVTRVVKNSANVDISYDERGLPTRTEYDANRNPIKVTYPDGSTTSATWDARFSLPLTRTDELGVTTSYDYDSQGNLLTMTEASGLPEQRITTATYDVVGQRLTQTVKGATPQEDATTTWTYDAHGNVATITDPLDHTTTLEHDVMGNVTKRTDARNQVWISQTNAMGWATSQKDPLDHETVMTYDTVGNRLTMTDPEGNTTT
jgi:YD repeat-containing protein